MQQRPFGELGAASALTLGGGGIGQVWGPTTRDECVATVREAVDSGIDVLDLAPSYGNGEAETVIGDASTAAFRPASESRPSAASATPLRARSTTSSPKASTPACSA